MCFGITFLSLLALSPDYKNVSTLSKGQFTHKWKLYIYKKNVC